MNNTKPSKMHSFVQPLNNLRQNRQKLAENILEQNIGELREKKNL